MKQTLILISLICFSTGNIMAQHTIEVKGKIKFIEPKMNKIEATRHEGTQKIVVAETPVNKDGTYKLTINVDKPQSLSLSYPWWQSVNIWVEDENLEVDFHGRDTAKIVIKNPPYVYIRGGKNNEVMNWINFERYRNYQQMIELYRELYNSKIHEDEKEEIRVASAIGYSDQENYRAHMRYICEHYADRTSVIAAINDLDEEKDAALIEKTLNTLEKSNPKVVANYRATAKKERDCELRMQIGQSIPEFEAYTPKGKKMNVQNFKGKVLVLDFWASWCGPCRQEVPNLKKAYEEFKNKNVEFLSVSVDAKKEDWIRALKEENMPWPQAQAPNGGRQVMDTYQFSGIPFILVIDQNGYLYRKNVRGQQIQEAIYECLTGKPTQDKKKSQRIKAASMM